jgi:hypothetical protein
LAALFVAMGAYALIAQTALLRQFLVVFGGNELALGLFFGAWFLGIGAGASALGGPAGRGAPAAGWLRAAAALGVVLPPASLIAMKTMPVWLHLPPGLAATWRVIGLAGLLCAPLGFWIGAVFPLFAAAARDDDAIGRMFVWEAVGSAAGGLSFSFVLALFAPPVSAAAASSLTLAVGLIAAEWPPSPRRSAAPLAALALAAFVFSPLGDRAEQALERLRFGALGPGAQFERSIQTRYQNVTFAQSGGQTQLYGDGAYLDSFPDEYVRRQEAALLAAGRAAAGVARRRADGPGGRVVAGERRADRRGLS